MNERNLVDLFLKQAEKFGERTVLRAKKDGHFRDISWKEFRVRVSQIALALSDLKIQKGDRIALLSENRPEWAYVDLAILAAGAVTVPVYPTASLNDVQHVLNHCEAKILFVSSQE
ncbi:MAG: AMP-binding protein, partial [Candidatus Omnitrophica bacterium]|nr:AMP-binding protein [Candidatus Omnitrophota bacterium]